MARSRAILLSLLLSSSVVLSEAINLPPATLFGTGQQICNYRYAVPNGQDCVTYGPSLEHHLDVVQQDMDRIKLQYVSQNTVLQEELRKLRQQASTTDANLVDLTKDMKTLQDTVFNLQAQVTKNTQNNGNNNGNGNSNSINNAASNALLQQLVTNTRSQLTQNMIQLQSQVNTALASVHADMQRDSVQQSKVDTAFQQQLRQQQQDLTRVLQSLQQLQQSVITLQQQQQHQQQATTSRPPYTQPPVIVTTPTKKVPQTPAPQTTAAAASSSSSGPVTVTPDPLLLQLQQDLKQLDSRVSSVEKDVQSDMPDLKKNLGHLQELVSNQSTKISDIKLEVDFVETNEMVGLRNDIQKNYGAISQLTQTVQRDLPPLKDEVQKVAQNVTGLNQQILRLGTDFFSQKVQMNRDEQKITDLETQVHLQASRLSRLIQEQHFTTPKPPSTPPPTTAAIHVPTPRPKGSQSSIIAPTPRHG